MINIRYHYSDTAPSYEKITRRSGYDRVPPRLVSLFQEAAAFDPGMQVLDFGCGTGKLSQAIMDTQVPVDIVGMEPCEGMSERFLKRFKGNPHVKLIRDGYQYGLRLPDESYDAVLSTGVFDHIKITPHVMKEFMRVIKPKGFLAFTYERHSRLFPFDRMSWTGDRYSHRDEYVRQCLEDAGAEIKKHDRMFGYFYFHLARMGLFVAQKPG